MSEHTPAASHISNLSEDVLLEVFKLCLPGPACTRSIHPPSEAPILLTQICQLWRRLAFDSPLLWTTLRIRLLREKCDATTMETLSTYLSHCGSSPIHLQLVFTYKAEVRYKLLCERVEGPEDGTITAKKLAEVRRLRGLPEPGFPQPAFLRRFFPSFKQSITRLALIGVPVRAMVFLPGNSFPVLERLILVFRNVSEWQAFDWGTHGPITAFYHSTSLRYVALRRIREHVERVLLPWDHITHFVEGITTGSSLHHLVTTLPSPQLRYFHASMANEDLPISRSNVLAWGGVSPQLSSNVETLSVVVYAMSFVWPLFLLFFQFPRLRRLQLSGNEIGMGQLSQTGEDRFRRRLSELPGLEHLSLFLVPSSGWTTGIEHIFPFTIHITTLDIHMSTEVFSALTLRDDNSYLPNLRYLNLHKPDHKDFDEIILDSLESFNLFLSSRLPAVSDDVGLKTITVLIQDPPLDSVTTFVQAAKQAVRDIPDVKIRVEEVPTKIQERYLNHWATMDKELEGWSGIAELCEY
ncbi:hypothetical protein DFP72DRAFT_884664 [Ephemerocybe angulata]|uniref:F-box domain-containing protein n=1 Tax=Ephemerocybe angulata TaxID=980116 RepID=A0A8H6I8P2_9AGAR|nr:hypothetical protein DFP72DRAFT_884664 [Tulosesus angulatus]